MNEIKLEITAKGGVRMLHDDAVDLSEFGKIEVCRASRVEYFDGNGFIKGRNGVGWGVKAGWYVQGAKTLDVLAGGFETRAEALAWEKQYFSPGGAGWAELTEGS